MKLLGKIKVGQGSESRLPSSSKDVEQPAAAVSMNSWDDQGLLEDDLGAIQDDLGLMEDDLRSMEDDLEVMGEDLRLLLGLSLFLAHELRSWSPVPFNTPTDNY